MQCPKCLSSSVDGPLKSMPTQGVCRFCQHRFLWVDEEPTAGAAAAALSVSTADQTLDDLKALAHQAALNGIANFPLDSLPALTDAEKDLSIRMLVEIAKKALEIRWDRIAAPGEGD